MSFIDFDEPFYGGSSVSTLVPHPYPVSLNGRPYLVDFASKAFRRQSIPLLRNQADTANLPGEQSLSPETYWRRAQEDWSKGAGQRFLDRPDSDPARFRTSKGVDVWDRWELSLLPDTTKITTSLATNLALAVAGGFLYEVDGNELYHRSAIAGARTSAAIHVAEAATSVRSIASDGFHVYAALGANGIHRTQRGAAVSSHFSDLAATLLGYVKGRLMAAVGSSIYNVVAGGAAPVALFTHPNPDFAWVGFAEGQAAIYAAGFSGDKSLIYRTTVKPDGTALDAPVVAGELPEGEVVRSIQGYLGGFVLLGTDKGLRMARPDDRGDLTIGAFIETPNPVLCFEGQERFCWYGLTNYDAVSTGLGRLDLSILNGSAPAYASDLMAAGQGAVTTVVTFDDRRVFSVAGAGIFAEHTSLVPEGTLDTGDITFGLPDPKVAMYLDLRHEPLVGTVAASVAKDGRAFAPVGESAAPGSTTATFPAEQLAGEQFEARLTLRRSSTDVAAGPKVTRQTLRAYPTPARGEIIMLPIILADTITVDGEEQSVDCLREFNALVRMETEARLVSYQEGATLLTVRVEDHEFRPERPTANRAFFQGLMLVRLKSYDSGGS